ncbi:hypothetical protein [Cellulophaga sp. HaHa_2_1]|uniref:hypothetical protein n=1 Tax=Cellulophaga sp. HaHa_2_1 TaxID=2749994 RepID=UPI001C4FEC34|nr:hypothetical protein [Cellulophaga sp. HaHa_2_1]QXP53658.1 hypothetical protein H0I24_06930 [Cellulophaga sp. HaHa_2_1]
MKKMNLLTYVLILSTTIVLGQTNCTELESDNASLKSELITKDGIITTQNVTIDQQKKEVLYYKETLALINSKITTENKEVSFKINSVTGNSDTGTVMIEGILINNGVLRSIQGHKANAFDPKGNGIMSYKMTVGNETRIAKLLKDIPTKFAIELNEIVSGTPIITALLIDFYSNVGYKKDGLNIVFKNLNVHWE